MKGPVLEVRSQKLRAWPAECITPRRRLISATLTPNRLRGCPDGDSREWPCEAVWYKSTECDSVCSHPRSFCTDYRAITGPTEKVESEKLLRQFSQQFSAITKIFGMHEENSASIANLDERVFLDVSPHKNDRGPCRNGHYSLVILLGQNGPTPIS